MKTRLEQSDWSGMSAQQKFIIQDLLCKNSTIIEVFSHKIDKRNNVTKKNGCIEIVYEREGRIYTSFISKSRCSQGVNPC